MSRNLNDYCDAMFGNSPRVLGLKLKPFCLSHVLRMKELGCPFASDDEGQEASLGDFMQAVLICSRSHDEFNQFLNGKEIVYEHWFDIPILIWNWLLDKITHTTQSERWLKNWDRKLVKALECRRFPILSKIYRGFAKFQKKPLLNGFDELEKFQEYRRKGLKLPKIGWNGKGSNPVRSGSHWSAKLFNALRTQLNYSENEALNMPLARAFIEIYQYMENNGQAYFFTDDELDLLESVSNGKS